MSRMVKLSDVFEEDFEKLLVAAMRLAQKPGSTGRKFEYVELTARVYEYDTKFKAMVDRALSKVR